MNKTIKNKNGEITFEVCDGYFTPTVASDIAQYMSTGEFYALLEACDGDFSRFSDNTRRAMVIKSQSLHTAYQEALARKALYRKERAERRHNEIIAEIRELMEGHNSFTSVEIQLAAVNRGNGWPVRTRQMYTSHLRKAAQDNIVERDFSDTSGYINVILRNGRKSHQRIPGTKRCAYKFIK